MARILIIDDNADNLELMTYLLENFGHQVLVATNGVSGVAAALSEHPDLIVCDIQMPGADGYAVVKAIKNDPAIASIPIVAVTALAMTGDRTRILAAGFDHYISKPIDPQRFVGDLEALLRIDLHGASPAMAAEASCEQRPLRLSRCHILVVDDTASNRQLMLDTLQPFGFEVSTADSVDTALLMVRTRIPDLIISDLHMPGADGFHLIAQLKSDATLRQLPMILLSSSSWNGQDRDRAYELGVELFLLRPIEPVVLISEIEAFLRRKE